MSNSYNGAMLNGKQLFDNSGSDTGWVDISNDSTQFFAGATSSGSFLMYRIVNSTLFVNGMVQNNGYDDSGNGGQQGAILKLNDKIQVPDNLSISTLNNIVSDNGAFSENIRVNDSWAKQNGYLIALTPGRVGTIGSVGNLNFRVNLVIPLKTSGGGGVTA